MRWNDCFFAVFFFFRESEARITSLQTIYECVYALKLCWKSEFEVLGNCSSVFLPNGLPSVVPNPGASRLSSYRVCLLRAPCRLMLIGILNDLRGEAEFKNISTPMSATNQSQFLPHGSLDLKGKRPSVSSQTYSYHQQTAVEWVEQLNGLDQFRLFSGENPVVYQGSKVSAQAPFSLILGFYSNHYRWGR